MSGTVATPVPVDDKTSNIDGKAICYTIVTASGHKVSLTGFHLLSIVSNNDERKYKSAKDVKQGDVLRVVKNGQVYSSSVNNVTMEVKTGFYVPLTEARKRTFVSLKEMHIFVFCSRYLNPLRWYYRLSRLLFIQKPFGDKTVDGIHSVPQMLYEIVQLIYPSILRFS